MKNFFLFIALLLSVSQLYAQDKKILVVSDSPSELISLKNSFEKFFSGKILVSDTLPAQTDADAIFDFRYTPFSDFKDYEYYERFLQDGKFVNFHIYYAFSTIFENQTFWRKVGVERVEIAPTSFSEEFYRGVQGTFTEGLVLRVPSYKHPAVSNFGGVNIVSGSAYPVLMAWYSMIAVAFDSLNYKVVIGGISDVEFLQRVVCNYFNLCAPVSVEEKISSEENFLLTPNPVTDEGNISFSLGKPEFITFRLIDQMGKEIFSQKEKFPAGPNEKKFSFVNLPAGVYYLRIASENFSLTKIFLHT